eukprot:6520745-Pyramimonas_sp.AAC.1
MAKPLPGSTPRRAQVTSEKLMSQTSRRAPEHIRTAVLGGGNLGPRSRRWRISSTMPSEIVSS